MLESLTVCRCKQTVRWVAGSGRSAWELPLRTAVHLGLHQMGLADAGDWTPHEIGERPGPLQSI